jgi:tetratricopeptide (TPR) repeat protein
VRALLGAILRARGRFDEAANELRAALALEPDAPDVLMDLASIYNALGRQNEAESTLEHLLEVHPRCAVCAARAGHFHSQNGRLERAIEMYKRAIELAPDVATFHASLAAVHIKLGRYAEAVPLLETATRVSPSAISSSNLGYCHYLMGDYHEAARHFGEAVRLAPRSFLYRGNLGDALRLLPGHGNDADTAFDAAIAMARASLAINDNDPFTRALLSEYLAKRGDLETANAEIARALSETSPDAADIYLSAAIVRMLSGENASALEHLRTALEAGLSPSVVAVDPQFEPLRSEPEFERLVHAER